MRTGRSPPAAPPPGAWTAPPCSGMSGPAPGIPHPPPLQVAVGDEDRQPVSEVEVVLTSLSLESKVGRRAALTDGGGVEGGAAVDNVAAAGNDGAAAAVADEHDVGLRLGYVNVLPVGPGLDPDDVPLAAPRRCRRHCRRDRLEVPAAVGRHHHVGGHSALL